MTCDFFCRCGINEYAKLPIAVRWRGIKMLHALGYRDDVERLWSFEDRMRVEIAKRHPAPCLACRRRIISLIEP